jgi:SAM-dependent methyltransferase
MSYLDPARSPEERIEDAIAHGPDINARGRFGALTRVARKLVGRAVKYERDFNLQIDAALLQRIHEIEVAAEDRTTALDVSTRRAIEEIRASTDHTRDVTNRTLLRLEHELTLLTARIDASIADIESRLAEADARAAVANSIAAGAMDSIESVNRLTGELVDKTRFAYEELTALPYTADDDALRYTDSRGRVQLGYRGGSDAPAFAGFPDVFRGPESLVRDRQRPYLDVIGRRGPVIDLGCGRGEMLHLLDEAGIEAIGVDLDETMVDRARVFGEVHHGDAIDFLLKQDDASLGCIFSAQFIEHLPTARIFELLDVARAKLRSDGVFIAETVNPHSPRALKAFWIDPTHRHPLFPETMLALCRLAGFDAARIMFPLGSDDLSADLRTCGEYAVVTGSRIDD